MAETIYYLVNSEWFWILVVTWFVIGIIWAPEFKALVAMLNNIVSRPVIFDHDPGPIIPFYPRPPLERIATTFRRALKYPLTQPNASFEGFIRGQQSIVYHADYRLRTYAYLFLLICFIFFVFVDAVAIANAMQAIGYTEALPPILLRYDLATGGATFLAVIVGFIVLSQTLAPKSTITHWDEVQGAWKQGARLISMLVIILGLAVGIALGIARLAALGVIEPSDTTRFLVELSVNVLIIVTATLAAALIKDESLRGSVLLFVCTLWVLLGILKIVNVLSKIIGVLAPFIGDVLWRIVHGAVNIAQYFILAPIRAVGELMSRLFGWANDESRPSEHHRGMEVPNTTASAKELATQPSIQVRESTDGPVTPPT